MDDSLIASLPDAATPTERPTIAVPKSPLPCGPNRLPDWRWRTAINLAWISTHPEPCPDDPWLKEAVEFLAITKRGWGNQQPTLLQRASPEALATAIREAHASNLRETTAAACLYASMASWTKSGIEADAYVEYRDRLLADCGAPDDPLVVMLIEQVALAHINIARLHVKSAVAANYIESVAYEAAAARLLTELRRSVLVLEDLKVRGTGKARSSSKEKPADQAKPTAKAHRKGRTENHKNNGHSDKLPPRNEGLPKCLKDRLIGRNPIVPSLETLVRASGLG
jgi:hypothetical protein